MQGYANIYRKIPIVPNWKKALKIENIVVNKVIRGAVSPFIYNDDDDDHHADDDD